MEKQIEEIYELTTVLYEANHKKSVLDYHWLATEAYNAGYRKQINGQWETIPHKPRGEMFNVYSHICSACNFSYRDVLPNGYKFCPHCGAHMKGAQDV